MAFKLDLNIIVNTQQSCLSMMNNNDYNGDDDLTGITLQIPLHDGFSDRC